MQLTTSILKEIKKGEFTLDISTLNGCKGLIYLEIKPLKRLDTLILDSQESNLISFDNPYVISSFYPITKGILTFKPYNSSNDMETLIRALIIN